MERAKTPRTGHNTLLGRNDDTTLSVVVIFALLFILLIPAFQGTHQVNGEFFFLHLISAVSILLILLIRQDQKLVFLKTKLDYLLCAVVILYVISIFWSYYPKLALEEALKYLNYFLVFWLMAHVVPDSQIKPVIKTLFLLGLLLAAVAFGIQDGADLIRGERLVSTLTYANVFAVYLAAMIVLGYYLLQTEKKAKPLYLLGTYFLTLAFIGAQSRLMWLIFFPGILIFGVGFPEDKLKCLLNIISVSVLAFVASLFIFDHFPLYFKLGVLSAGGLISYGLFWGMNKLRPFQQWVKILFSLLILAIIISACFFAYYHVDFHGNVNSIINRLKSVVDLDDLSVRDRIVYYQDALKIMEQSNFLGGGGGTWQVQNPLLKSYHYFSVEPHSHFWKTGVEIGVVGLFLFVSVFLFVTFYLWKKRRNAETWSLGMAFLLIYLHSLFDFDLSFGFMALVAWILLGLFNHKVKKMSEVKNTVGVFKERKISKLAARRFISLYLLILLPLTLSYSLSSTTGPLDSSKKARAKLEKAIFLYPLNAENYASLGNAHYRAYFQTRKPQDLAKAVEMSEKALDRQANNYYWYVLKGRFLYTQGELESVLTVLAECHPYICRFENNKYAQLAQLYKQVAEKAKKEENPPLGRRANEGIIELWEQAKAEMATVDPRYLSQWAEEETLVQSDIFLIEVIQAYLELGDQERAKELLPELSEETLNKNPWLEGIE